MGEHPGVLKARQYLDEFAKGDPDSVRGYFSDDVVWHVGGNHPLSGDYKGIEQLIDYFKRVRELTGGSLSLEPLSILASDQHTAMFTNVRAEREGKSMDVVLAQVFSTDPDGRWREYWALADKQEQVDDFWS